MIKHTLFNLSCIVAIAVPGLAPGALAVAPQDATQYALPAAPTGSTKVDLQTKIYRSWKIRLPAESWRPVGKGLTVAGWGDTLFRAQLDGTSLVLDTDADGKLDTTVASEGGVIALTKGARRLAIRLRSKPDWSFAPASVKSGEIEGTRVRLIDQDNNGRFDDFGADAMVVGIGNSASFLSKVVRVADKLYAITVAADGAGLTYAPYTGATSQIDFKVLTKGKVLAAVLRSSDQQYSFDVSQARTAIRVPAGRYLIHSGLLSFGGNKVSVRTGRSKPIVLAADAAAEVRFGGPIDVEFGYRVQAGNKFEFSPDAIWYYGRGGEEYHDWQPLGKSPLITVDDRQGKRIAEVIFPPSC
jgi:hypothetical protein